VYTVETDGQAQQQVDALPAEALTAYAELRVLLETSPWSGAPYRRENPGGGLRVRTFDNGRGLVVYLILDDQRRVDILQVQWVDLPFR
jgi:hypothetical protein